MRRRRFLTATAAAGALLAGCQGGSDGESGSGDGAGGTGGDGTDSSDGSGGGDGGTTTRSDDGASDDGGGDDGGGSDGGGTTTDGGGTPVDVEYSLPDHPALAAIDSQPFLGPEPGSAQGLIVAFEDPSCPRCAAFEKRVFPEIRSNLVDTGKATYVFRGYPVVYEWGEPATHALEAVYAADEAAFWDLAEHYFDDQDSFTDGGPDVVYDWTENYLSQNTDLDATAVIDRARNGDVDAAVQADLDAGKNAGAGRTTPHLFLFKNGEYQTKAAGSVSYSVVESALGF